MSRSDPILRGSRALLQCVNLLCNAVAPHQRVSYADKEILHCILKGLADEDIRRQVLGVMDLDATTKFIETKESDKKAGVFL